VNVVAWEVPLECCRDGVTSWKNVDCRVEFAAPVPKVKWLKLSRECPKCGLTTEFESFG
jgi:hypothetical protein